MAMMPSESQMYPGWDLQMVDILVLPGWFLQHTQSLFVPKSRINTFPEKSRSLEDEGIFSFWGEHICDQQHVSGFRWYFLLDVKLGKSAATTSQ